MVLKNKDFVEIEFTGRTKDGEIFDSNVKENLEKANLNSQAKPFIFSLGQGMFLKGVDDYLIGKQEEPKKYKIELSPEDAFGKRNPKLIERMPSYVFKQQNVRPVPGVMFNFDGRIGKIIAVSGGRVIVDFNNPVAGKDVIYDLNVLRKVEDLKEKVRALNKFFFKKNFDFEISNDNKKIVIDLGSQGPQYNQYKKLIELFNDKFKEILGMSLEVKENQNKENKTETKEAKKP